MALNVKKLETPDHPPVTHPPRPAATASSSTEQDSVERKDILAEKAMQHRVHTDDQLARKKLDIIK